ncbi:MAG: hypothetical protein F6K10_42540 [Moorea sp. SIO2B7]|nr:hypothetical protein [Moorena sp. SIO2B7]
MNGVAFVLEQLNKEKEALAVYKRALKIKPDAQATLSNYEQLSRKLADSKILTLNINSQKVIALGAII